MSAAGELRTDRLWLRRWRPDDRLPFAQLNADPEVRRFFPSVLSRAESDAAVDRMEAHWREHGFGPWAVSERPPGRATFFGCVGLSWASFEAPFTPCVEILWRLAHPRFGRGFASEAATAALRHGFDALGLDEVVAFTAVQNRASRRVMERIGMRRDAAGDFDHPALPPGHALRRHVLYRARR